MRKTLTLIAGIFSRYRAIVGLLIIFFAGSLFALTVSTWYFNNQLETQARGYNRQVNRLVKDIDLERKTNRDILYDIVRRVDKLTDDVARITNTAGNAAATANQAATQAKAAAANAAKANIRIQEIPLP